MQHPNATWNEFSTHLINIDVSYEVSTSFLNDEEQNKAQMASLGKESKKPTSWAEGTQNKPFRRKPKTYWP